jgi:hypothetical protein
MSEEVKIASRSEASCIKESCIFTSPWRGEVASESEREGGENELTACAHFVAAHPTPRTYGAIADASHRRCLNSTAAEGRLCLPLQGRVNTTVVAPRPGKF